MKTIAPAKINWTLEVLGKRDDGYHEIRSVMQTIDLCDEVCVERAEELRLEVKGDHEASEDDLTLKAARLLGDRAGRELPGLIRIEKRIPAAAGLGGGSSDAAAVLLTLERLWGLGWSREQLVEVAPKIGSDVPFFLYGGTALVDGKGERVTPLPDGQTDWVVLLIPPMKMPEKTKRMYAALENRDFGDGSRTASLVRSLRDGRPVREADICSAFERAAYLMFDGLDRYRDALLHAGVRGVHVAGSGPALFALTEGEAEAREIASNVQAMAGEAYPVRTLGVWEATDVNE